MKSVAVDYKAKVCAHLCTFANANDVLWYNIEIVTKRMSRVFALHVRYINNIENAWFFGGFLCNVCYNIPVLETSPFDVFTRCTFSCESRLNE